MNPTFRRVLAAGLGSLAMTEKAVRQLVDDLVKKGDISRAEGEKLLGEAEKKWNERKGGLEKAVDSALEKALDRFGLARKTEVAALEHRIARMEGGRARSRSTNSRATRGPVRRKRPAPGSPPTSEPPKE
jgi:polyhydroxyalkanoate synthesis regulator phasin